MLHLTKLVSFSLVIIHFFSAPIYAQEEPLELYIVNYPPYMIVDGKELSGIDVEVTQAAFAKMGIKIKISAAPWKRILKNLEHGRIAGALTCSKRSDRLSFIDYSDTVSEANQVAVMSVETDDSKLVNFSDLKQFKVMAVEGWGIQRELTRKGIEHETTQAMGNGIKSVIFRDIDVFYNGELTTLYRAQQLKLQDKIKTKRFLDKPSTTFHLCLSKKYTGDTDLLEKFNIGLSKVKDSGEFAAIYKKYL